MSVAVRGAEAARLRLAELVAALSLGVDLGFGQPTEHVVRQCLIALRVADRIGLDEPQRLAVYYFALLLGSARSAARPMLRHLHGPAVLTFRDAGSMEQRHVQLLRTVTLQSG